MIAEQTDDFVETKKEDTYPISPNINRTSANFD